MTKFKFCGTYTNGATTINVGGPDEVGGVTFEGNEPIEVERPDLIERLSRNPEFKVVGTKPQLDHDGDGEEGGSLPKGRAHKDDMKALREQYEFVTGKKPFAGWSAEILREKIANK